MGWRVEHTEADQEGAGAEVLEGALGEDEKAALEGVLGEVQEEEPTSAEVEKLRWNQEHLCCC